MLSRGNLPPRGEATKDIELEALPVLLPTCANKTDILPCSHVSNSYSYFLCKLRPCFSGYPTNGFSSLYSLKSMLGVLQLWKSQKFCGLQCTLAHLVFHHWVAGDARDDGSKVRIILPVRLLV